MIFSKLKTLINLFNTKLKIREHTFHLPLWEALCQRVQCPYTEPWMEAFLEKNKDANSTFIDVGVNIGQTLLKFKAVGAKGRYIGFEANPHCFPYVRRLLQLNNLNDYIVIPAGLGERTALHAITLNEGLNVSSGASMIKQRNPAKGRLYQQYIPVYDFDSIREQLCPGKISLIKIDVEGAELQVLQGLIKTLQKDYCPLLIEIDPVTSKTGDLYKNNQRIFDFLKAQDYNIYRIVKGENNYLKRLEHVKAPVIQPSNSKRSDYRDFLAIPSNYDLSDLPI